jgi:hypothetical protein
VTVANLRIATVNKAINHPNVELVKGEGYFYFVYDKGDVYETRSVMVNSLNELPLDQWVEEAKDLIAELEN